MSKKYKYELPDDCPECIKNKQIEPPIEIYRICKHSDLVDIDYVPLYFSKNPEDFERIKGIKKKSKICQSSGLSVHTDKDEIIKKTKKMPMLGKYISSAKIKKEGEIYKTSTSRWPTHMTFYTCESYNEIDFFKMIEKED